jgi:putative spermidine/putrescine transport system ATP-binding protein
MAESADVEVRQLSKRYGGVPVLRDVSFSVPNGESMALLGPSGCGKSTTLSIIAGVTHEDSGDVIIGGHDMKGLAPHRRGIGVVFQSYALFPHMTVQRNVEFGPRAQGQDKAETKRLVEQALAMTHLSQFRDRLPKQLSGGQQQRVALARALASQPRLLLLDEPLSSLDANLREEMQHEIRDLQVQTGISMIFVTHDQQEAMAIGDQVGVILNGQMHQTGTPEELYGRPQDINVARLLGKISTLRATVAGFDGSSVQLSGPAGERWVGMLPIGQTAQVGGSAVVMVRPEALKIVPRKNNGAAPANVNSVDGVIKRTTFLGRELNALVDVGFAALEVRCDPTAGLDLQAGHEVSVVWAAEQSTVFNESAEQDEPDTTSSPKETAKASQ